MKIALGGIAPLLAGVVFLPCIQAQTKETPVGLILSAREAGIARRNGPEIGAIGGELLYPGDRLRTRAGGSVAFVFCTGEEGGGTRHVLNSEGEMTVERGRLVDSSKKLAAAERVEFCKLPEVEAEPEVSSKATDDLALRVADAAAYAARAAGLPEAVRSRLAALDRALHANPKDLLAMTSRAALLQENGLAPESADQYAEIAAAWQGQQWAKMLVQSSRRAAAPVRRGTGTTYAVAIGISKYDSPDIRDLRFAHRDALQFAEYLTSKRGNELPKEQVKLLIDGEATLPRIRESIKYLTTKAGKNDTVVFFISGHGAVSEGEGYLIPHHCDAKNLKDSGYPMSSLLELMYEMSPKVGRFIMFVDACRAGTIGQISERNAVNQRISTLVKNSADNLIALFASQQTELAWEHENFGEGHSAFSYFVLRAMAGENIRESDLNGDGKVSLSELIRYLQNQVPEATRDKQHPDKAVKIAEWSEENLVDLGNPGIKIAGWKPMPKEAFSGKGLKLPVSEPYSLEKETVPAAEEDLEKLIRLEEEAQAIMLRYLQGDEIPQTRADFERGRQLSQQALALAPGSVYLESRREFFHGRRLIFDKQYADAITHLETSIRLNPRSPSPYNALGIAYLELGRYPEAIGAFDAAIHRAWYWPYPRHNLALAYMQMGRQAQAIIAYRKAMELAPDYSYLPYNLGLIFYKLNRRRDAEDAYLHAKQLADFRAEHPVAGQPAEAYAERRAMPLIALALLKAGERGRRHEGESAGYYKSALALLAPYADNRNVLIARHNLALLAAKKKPGWTEAETLLKRNIAAGYLPSRQRMAEWLADRGDSAEAVPQFEALLEAKPEYTAARLRLAEQFRKLGDAAGEGKQLGLAREHDPQNLTVLLELAGFEARQKRWKAAREAYQAARQQASDPKVRRRIDAALRSVP